MDNDTLNKIINSCIQGCSYSEKLLFNHLYEKMLSVCMKYTIDNDSAQEVCQIGFIKAFDKLSEYTFKGSFKNWLKKIMINTSIDVIRKKKRTEIYTNDDFILECNSIYEQPVKYKSRYNISQILDAIESLSPQYKKVFNLYINENYTHNEIAEILNISEGSSKSNLSKAKKNIRDKLQIN